MNSKEDIKMKCTTYKIFYLSLVLLLIVPVIFGQNKKVAELTKNRYALQNIISGIHSENEQIRKSSIYFAGFYRLIETEDMLIKQLKTEQCPENKILIGLALFRMESEKGMKELQKLCKSEKNIKVKRMSYSICKEYFENKAI
jgi:hypothetical protein